MFAAILAAIGALVLLRALFVLLSGGASRVGLAVICLILTAWCLVNWRLSRLGVATNDAGVRIYGPLRTTTLPWSQVDDAVLLAEEGLFGAVRHTLWLLSPDGMAYLTPVIGQQPGGLGAIGFGLGSGYRVHLRPDEVTELAERLRTMAAQHR